MCKCETFEIHAASDTHALTRVPYLVAVCVQNPEGLEYKQAWEADEYMPEEEWAEQQQEYAGWEHEEEHMEGDQYAAWISARQSAHLSPLGQEYVADLAAKVHCITCIATHSITCTIIALWTNSIIMVKSSTFCCRYT